MDRELEQSRETAAAELSFPLGEFLKARRSRVQPEWVGIARDTGRRVEGLRRDEVAQRASMSQEYYLRLEQGRDRDPSPQVLRGIARALLLDESEQEYLFRIAQLSASSGSPVPRISSPEAAVNNIRRVLALWPSTPAVVTTANQDVVLVNEVAETIWGGMLAPGENLVELIFASPRRGTPEWEVGAREGVAALRFYGDPFDPRLREIVGLLSVSYPEFRRIWARHDVAVPALGRVSVDDHDGGCSEYAFVSFELPQPRGYRLIVLGAVDH